MSSIFSKQGRIYDNPVVGGWAGAVMRNPIAIQKCYGGIWTDGRIDRPSWQGVESCVRD